MTVLPAIPLGRFVSVVLITTLTFCGPIIGFRASISEVFGAEPAPPQPNVRLNGPVFTFWFSKTERISGLLRSVEDNAFLVELRGGGRIHRIPRQDVLAISRPLDRVVRVFDDFESTDRVVGFEPAVKPESVVPSPATTPATTKVAASLRCLQLKPAETLHWSPGDLAEPGRLSFRIRPQGKPAKLILQLTGLQTESSQPDKPWDHRIELAVSSGSTPDAWRTVTVDVGPDRLAVLLDELIVKLLDGKGRRLNRIALQPLGDEPSLVDDWCWAEIASQNWTPAAFDAEFLARVQRIAPSQTGVVTAAGQDLKELAVGKIGPNEIGWTDRSGATQKTEWREISAVVFAAAAPPTESGSRSAGDKTPTLASKLIEFMPRLGDTQSSPDQLRVTGVKKSDSQLTARHAILGEVAFPLTDVQAIQEK